MVDTALSANTFSAGAVGTRGVEAMHDPMMEEIFSIMRAQEVSAIRAEQDVTSNEGLLHEEVHVTSSERQRPPGRNT